MISAVQSLLTKHLRIKNNLYLARLIIELMWLEKFKLALNMTPRSFISETGAKGAPSIKNLPRSSFGLFVSNIQLHFPVERGTCHNANQSETAETIVC